MVHGPMLDRDARRRRRRRCLTRILAGQVDLGRDGLFNKRRDYSGPLRGFRLGSLWSPNTSQRISGASRARRRRFANDWWRIGCGRSSVGRFDRGRDTGLNRLAVDAYQQNA
jgi:hypothetical protein